MKSAHNFGISNYLTLVVFTNQLIIFDFAEVFFTQAAMPNRISKYNFC